MNCGRIARWLRCHWRELTRRLWQVTATDLPSPGPPNTPGNFSEATERRIRAPPSGRSQGPWFRASRRRSACDTLLTEGLLAHTRSVYALPGFYPLESIFLLLALLALVR